jgi:A/G-specific adenine glycosylase
VRGGNSTLTLNAQRSTLNSEFDGRWAFAFDVPQRNIFEKFARGFFGISPPRLRLWRRTRDPYAILVSEFMLQQTQVATASLHDEYPPISLISLTRCASRMTCSPGGKGYYARGICTPAQRPSHRHRDASCDRSSKCSNFQDSGRYTAGALASFAFNQPIPIVEANTARVLARFFDFRDSVDSVAGRKTLWQYGATLLPKSNARTYNSAFVDLGALVCIPREPKCGICPVKKFCRAKHPETLPIRRSRLRPTRLVEKHAFMVRQGKIQLEQSRRRWHGMWILPRLQTRPVNRRPIYESIFPFTNHRITLKVYAERSRKIDKHSQRWIRINSLESIPIPLPHGRALQHLLQRDPHK